MPSLKKISVRDIAKLCAAADALRAQKARKLASMRRARAQLAVPTRVMTDRVGAFRVEVAA